MLLYLIFKDKGMMTNLQERRGVFFVYLVLCAMQLFNICGVTCLNVADTPRYRGMVSELDCWMEWIDNQMADEVFEMQDHDDLEDFVGGLSVSL